MTNIMTNILAKNAGESASQAVASTLKPLIEDKQDTITFTDSDKNKYLHLSDSGTFEWKEVSATGSAISPRIAENPSNTEDVYKLDITDESGTFTTPNLKGSGGTSTGGGSYNGEMLSPLATNNFRVTPIDNCGLVFTWEDPAKEIYSDDGLLLCKWKGTKLVMKLGGYPENIDDGTVLVDSRVHSAYQNTGLTITSGFEADTTYYFKLFPYSEIGGVNMEDKNNMSAVPVVKAYITMTAVIDLSNSNPATCVTYEDSALEMTPGSSEWDTFFGYYPCIVKDGVETVKLNPNDYTKDINGNTVDLASTDVGDVMVAFPRKGLRITKSGTLITIKMTDNPVSNDFDYYAHRRGNTQKDVFYLGAFLSYLNGNVLQSWSGKVSTSGYNITNTRNFAHNKGQGYELASFFQLLYRQAMFILKYKALNSQEIIGVGFASNIAIESGSSNAWGMNCEIIKNSYPVYQTDGKHSVKCFGIENCWGGHEEFLDGICTQDYGRVYVTTNAFGNVSDIDTTGDTSHYTFIGNGTYGSQFNGYINNVYGTSLGGFTILDSSSGSSTTYFCDKGTIDFDTEAICGVCGGDASPKDKMGIFAVRVNIDATLTPFSSRIMYL